MSKFYDLSKSSHLSVKAKSKTKAEVVIYGVIGASFWEDGITDVNFQKELKALGDVEEIEVRINSVGGDVFQGWAIYNLLKQHKAKITTYVDGLAASIASIIALAGDTVIMGEGAQMMIHSAWTYTAGNARDLESVIDRLLSIDEQLIKTYAGKTKKDREHMRGLVQAETWFTAEEAVDIGLADKVEGESLAIAACFLDKFSAMGVRKVPRNIKTENDLAKEKVSNLKNSIEKFLARK